MPPLPPAPTRRAALLSQQAIDQTALPATRSRRKTSPVVSPPVSSETFADAHTLPVNTPVDIQHMAALTAPVTQAKAPPKRRSTARKTATASAVQQADAALASAPSQMQKSAASGKKAARGTARGRCMFVLDTNVLLHDPSSLFRFHEHDIFLPLVVLEELDAHKKGSTEVARNGRQVSRTLDALLHGHNTAARLADGLPLADSGHKGVSGHLYFQTGTLESHLPNLPQGKADNQILGVVQALREREQSRSTGQREIVLVSKDINMRVKAHALGLNAEDYRNDKVLDDGDLLYSGALPLPADFWRKAGKFKSWQAGGRDFYEINASYAQQMLMNQFVYFEAPGENSLYARVTEIRGDSVVLQTLRDYSNARNAVWGVTARNREQNFALNLLMDPEVDFVTLTGTAGTGKTLIALAAGLRQVLDERRYTEIIMTRATVNVGEDIGFLPGTEEEKMGPWMGALDDNLEFLAKGDGGNPGEWGRSATNDLIRSRIKIKSLNFMRGRTFLNRYVIIDEAQNLTPKQIKTLITRAGPGTKIVCMGNLAQIDTPYLTEGSSGLTYAVDRFKGWTHGGHIQLARGERSRLADFASEVL